MPFILRIYSYCKQPMPTPLSKRFDAAGGTIGRTAENDLVLEDPGKYISRKHARIECRDGDYYFVDLGCNPSLINDLPLGNGNEAKLRDGDRILIGDYLIEAVFEPEAGLAPAFSTTPVTMRPEAGPVIVSQPLVSASSPASDFLSDRSILYKGTLGELVGGADPLGLGLGPVVQADPLAPGSRGAQSDHVSPENQAFPLPDTATVSAPPAIPDDYDPLADLHPHPHSHPHPHPHPHPHSLTQPPAAAAAPAMPALAVRASGNEVLQALLRGLGLPALKTNRPPAETAEMVGAMLREAIRGTMSVLAARAATKREIRVDMTMLASQANNPLKFFADPEGALKQMLTNELPGYMSSQKAIGVAFDDLKSHEFAVIAGMRAALYSVLARFDPAAIENQLKASGVMDSMLPANRKAKLWDQLVDLYAEVMREADDDFQRLFGERFAAAYEEQVQRLHAGMTQH